MSRTRRLTRASLALVALGHVVAPIYFWNGGLIEAEATHFSRQYLDDRTVLQKVFDPHANDINTYQARELSYLFDYVDAQFFRSLPAYASPFFVPLSALLASCATVVVFYVGCARIAPLLGPLTATLLLFVYLSNHVYSVTTAVYYRSAKPLLAPVLLTTLFFLTSACRQSRTAASGNHRIVSGSFLIAFALGCFMSLLDRQGFVYAVVMLAALALWYRIRGGRRDLLWGSSAALSCMVIYNLFVAPWIVKHVNGYWPSFEYQKLDVLHLIGHPRHLVQAVRWLAQSTHVMLGSFSAWVYGGPLVLLVIWKLWDTQRTRPDPAALIRDIKARAAERLREPAVLLVCLVAGSQVFMVALMIIRHPPIWDWHDHRLWYYPLPYQVLVLFGIMLLLNRRAERLRSAPGAAVNALLMAVVVANFLSWPTYRAVMLASPWFPQVYYQSAILKRSFAERRPHDDLTQDYRTFYDFCVRAVPGLSGPRQ